MGRERDTKFGVWAGHRVEINCVLCYSRGLLIFSGTVMIVCRIDVFVSHRCLVISPLLFPYILVRI